MNDMTDSLAQAWKSTMRGVKRSYTHTAAALRRTLPSESAHDTTGSRTSATTGEAGVTRTRSRNSHVRRLFFRKYAGTSRHTSGGGGSSSGTRTRSSNDASAAAAATSTSRRAAHDTNADDGGADSARDGGGDADDAVTSDADSIDDAGPLSDAQVHAQVADKYFDKNYDAVRDELAQMAVTYADDEAAVRAERAAAEVKLTALRAQCDVVSTTLKKRVLTHHAEFMRGVQQIRQLNDSLFRTSSDGKKARAAVRRSKAAVAAQLALLAQQRTREHLRRTVALLRAMHALWRKRNELMLLIDAGRLLDAAALLQRNDNNNNNNDNNNNNNNNNNKNDDDEAVDEEALRGVYAMRGVLSEWQQLRRDPATQLRRCADAVLTHGLTTKFSVAVYTNVWDAVPTYGRVDDVCALVASLLWRTAVRLLTRSLVEMSHIKDETAALPDVAAAVAPELLLLCVCQMSARLTDYVLVYRSIVRVHAAAAAAARRCDDGRHDNVDNDANDDDNNNSNSNSGSDSHHDDQPHVWAHAMALRYVRDIGRRIHDDVVEKLTLVLAHMPLARLDVDHVLHLFGVVGVLLAALAALGVDAEAQAVARTRVRAVLQRYMFAHFHRRKACELLRFVSDDDWCVSAVSATSLHVVRPLSPRLYRSAMAEVRRYLAAHDNDDNDDDNDDNTGRADGGNDDSNNSAMASSASRHKSNGSDATRTTSHENSNNSNSSNNNNGEDGHRHAWAAAANPFYASSMLQPPDLTGCVHTHTLAECWTAAKNTTTTTTSDKTANTATTRTTAADCSVSTLAADATSLSSSSSSPQQLQAQPPVVLTSSALAAANVLLEYEARVVARYPPLAADVLDWCVQLCALYAYTVMDSFVSISRVVPLAQQGGLTPATQRTLTQLSTLAAHAVGARDGVYVPWDEDNAAAATPPSSTSTLLLLYDAATPSSKATSDASRARTAAAAADTPSSRNNNSNGGSSSSNTTQATNKSSNALATTTTTTAAGALDAMLTNSNNSSNSSSDAATRFPPRLGSTLRGELASAAHYFALPQRVTACEACITLVLRCAATVRALAPLLPDVVTQQQLSRCRALYAAMVEALHVLLHRLCCAILPLERVCESVAKVKAPRNGELHASAYVDELLAAMRALLQQMATRGITTTTKVAAAALSSSAAAAAGADAAPPRLERLVRRHIVYTAQTVLLREYGKLAKRKLSDLLVMQLQVDAQTFQQHVAAAFGRDSVVLPSLVVDFVKAGFLPDARDERAAWLRRHHRLYASSDVLYWLAAGDRTLRLYLQDTLTSELHHVDCLPDALLADA